MEVPTEIWSMVVAAVVGVAVRVISNRRLAALRAIIDEKDEMIDGAERDCNEVRTENLRLARERFRLRQRLAEHDLVDPTSGDLPITEEKGKVDV